MTSLRTSVALALLVVLLLGLNSTTAAGPTGRSFVGGGELATGELQGRAASLPQINISGNSHMTISSSETVGNITVSGNASLLVQGSSLFTLSVAGNITLEENGTLYVNHSGLDILQDYDWQYPLQVLDDARLTLRHCGLQTGGWIWYAHFLGNSNSTFENVTVTAPNWIGAFIADTANYTYLNSTIGSDVQLLQGPGITNDARLRLVDSTGFDILTSFPSASTANVSLPSVDPANHHFTWLNWTFPGGAQVSGIGYTIDLQSDRVWHVGAYIYAGAHVTLVNAVDIDVAFFLYGSSATFSGFRDAHYTGFSYSSDGFDLQLYNLTVEQWTWYPEVHAFVHLEEDDVGQVIPQAGSNALITDSNYTGLAGPLSSVDTSTVTIENSTIYSQVESESQSVITVLNCSIYASPLDAKPVGVLASGTSSVILIGSTLASGLSAQAQQSGHVSFENPVSLTAEFPTGSPASDASAVVRWSPNGTEVAVGTATAEGILNFTLLQQVVTSTKSTWLENYTVAITLGSNSAFVNLTMARPLSLLVVLQAPLQLEAFTATPSSIALGDWTNLSVNASGGTGPLTYQYTGLPAACASLNRSWLTCDPAQTGNFTVRVFVNDSVAHSLNETTILTVLAVPGSALTGVSLSPATTTLTVNANQTFSAAPVCGTGACPAGTTYAWSLSSPSLGNLSAATGASTIFTAGSRPGTLTLTIAATLDHLTKTASALITIASKTTSAPSMFLYYAVALVIVVVTVVLLLLFLRHRRKEGPLSRSADPPTGEPDREP